VRYNSSHWELLNRKRERALEIIESLNLLQFDPLVYGSTARGDVHQRSDIDVVLLNPNLLYLDQISGHHRYIVQATPRSVPKAYISLDPDELEVLSFPLAPLPPHEYEFFLFGGVATFRDLKDGVRRPGVNKALILLVPNQEGHIELPLKGNEEYAVKLTGASMSTIIYRENLLTRRKELGHTGVFLKYDLQEESFEEAFVALRKRNKFFRRALDA